MNTLLKTMISHADPSQVAGLSRFFKTGPGQYGEGDKFLGIKVPVTREVVKECWREVSFPELEECIISEYHEVRLAALLTLVEVFRHAGRRSPIRSGMTKGESGMTEKGPGMAETGSGMTKGESGMMEKGPGTTKDVAGLNADENTMTKEECVDFYLNHTGYINNWDLVDLSCYPLLGEWLLDKDRTLLYDLARKGKTIWEQRIGIVSTMTFIRHGQLSDTFAIADILLHHPHDLLHKAVGWLLREAGKRDKSALEAYLNGVGYPVGAGYDVRSDVAGRDDGSNVAWRDDGGDGAGYDGGNCDADVVAGDGVAEDVAGASGRDGGTGSSGDSRPRYQCMPRTMLRYAIEKFPEDERRSYLIKI